MRRRALLALLAVSPLLAGASEPSGWVLPPAAQGGFQRIVTDVNADRALGEGVALVDVSLQGSEARLAFRVAGSGEPVVLVLTHPAGAAAERTRWFVYRITPPSDAFTRALPALTRLLDARFTADPWVPVLSTTRAAPASGFTTGPRWRALLGYAGAVLVAVASLGVLLSAAPKPAEHDDP